MQSISNPYQGHQESVRSGKEQPIPGGIGHTFTAILRNKFGPATSKWHG